MKDFPKTIQSSTILSCGSNEDTFYDGLEASAVSPQEKFRALTNALGDASYEYCLKRNMVRWSEQCEAVFGVAAKELSRDCGNWLEAVHPEDRAGICEEYWQALRENRPFKMTYRLRHRKGQYLWIRERGSALTDADGKLSGVVGVIKDITPQRRRDEDLRLAKRALESSINGIVLTDLEGRLTYANHAFRKLFDYKERSEMLGSPVSEFWRNTNKAMAVFQLLKKKGEWSGLVAARGKDGSSLDVELSAHVVLDPECRPIGYMASFIDITEKRKAERERLQAEKKYQLLFSSSSDAMVVCHAANYGVVDVNPAAINLYGYTHQEFLQLEIVKLAKDPEAARLRLQMTVEQRKALFTLVPHLKKDGSCFDAEISTVTFKLKNDLLIAVFIRDVSERERIERLKDEVLSAVSHEMRTPLTAILGYTEYMRNYDLDPQLQNQYLDIVRQQGERLRELIENHLNLQQLRAGFGVGQVRPVEIRSLLHGVVGTFPEHVDNLHISVRDFDRLRPVHADESLLHRALENLLSNAIKYSPAGSRVTLGVSCEDEQFVTLYVRDEGIGIPHEIQGKIFDRYFRLCPSEMATVNGTGLGLALVSEIVKAHQGRLWVESAPGKGSTFFISLPASVVENGKG